MTSKTCSPPLAPAAHDHTWLDGFPVARTDYPLPFDMQLQAKPTYWGIVDPMHLPGYGLKFSLTSISGPSSQQVWTITATNGNAGPAYNTLVDSFTLKQVSGRRCNAVIESTGTSFTF